MFRILVNAKLLYYSEQMTDMTGMAKKILMTKMIEKTTMIEMTIKLQMIETTEINNQNIQA